MLSVINWKALEFFVKCIFEFISFGIHDSLLVLATYFVIFYCFTFVSPGLWTLYFLVLVSHLPQNACSEMSAMNKERNSQSINKKKNPVSKIR